ncbi:MAG: hypothetical protein ABI461_22580 [Polyangiaceae bacterium]
MNALKWIAVAGGAAVVGALIACGATANTPGEGDGIDEDSGLPIYDAGHIQYGDAGETDDDADTEPTCTSTTTTENCGVCGNVCPGLDASASTVTCGTTDGGATPSCGLNCQGEAYDVNGDAGDGCEKKDNPAGNHAAANAIDQGTFSCKDSDSQQNMMGIIVSDQRTHDPVVPGFSTATGAATDYFTIEGSGGTFCQDDLNLNFTVTGSKTPACYVLHADTDKGSYVCTADPSNGTCAITNGSGSYGSGSTITVYVVKTCSNVTHETATYTITGHL